jgi:hypothetical protein
MIFALKHTLRRVHFCISFQDASGGSTSNAFSSAGLLSNTESVGGATETRSKSSSNGLVGQSTATGSTAMDVESNGSSRTNESSASQMNPSALMNQTFSMRTEQQKRSLLQQLLSEPP